MGLFDQAKAYEFNVQFVSSFKTLAEAAKTAADAYAKYVEAQASPKYVVNVNRDNTLGISTIVDEITHAVKKSNRPQDG